VKIQLRGWWNGKELTGAMSLKIQEGSLWVEQPRWVEVTEKARLTNLGEEEVIRARPGEPFKYLGVWFDTDGTWRRQVAELQKMVGWYSSIAEVNHLTVAQSVLQSPCSTPSYDQNWHIGSKSSAILLIFVETLRADLHTREHDDQD
jgi:hypothetical protein